MALRCRVALAAAMALAAPVEGRAQRADDKVWFQAGAYFTRNDSDLRISANALDLGTEVDLESDLGLDKTSTVFNGVLGYRFAKRWLVEAEYFNLGRKSARSIDREIVVDNTLWNARVGASYRFHKHMGIGAGWRLTSYDVGIDRNDWQGRIEYKFNGPFVVFEAGF